MNATTQYRLSAADLEVILSLARAGNLAEAGKRLGADTSTIFRSVQRIEKHLGQALFTRSRKGYFATDIALQMVAHAEKIEAELEAARSVSLGAQDEVAGLVRITTVDAILYNLLIPHLAALGAKHPKLQLEIVSSLQVANLSKRDADIAIRATTRPPEHLIGHCLGRAHFAIYGAHSLFKGKRALKNLEEYDWVALDDGLAEDPAGKWRRKNYPKVVPRYRFESLIAVAEAVRAGLGIGALSTFKAGHDPELRALTPELENCSIDVWVLAHPDSRHLRRIAAVYNYIAQTIRLG